MREMEKLRSDNKRFQADMMLVLVTLCWGVSYYMMDICLIELSPFTLNSYRFLGAFVVAVILGWNKMKGISRITVIYSILIGTALFFTYIGATFGVMYTSLSNAGFLCALAVVICPVLNFVFRKKKPEKKLALVVVMCTVGIALLTLNESLSFAFGDLLCMMCAFAYAIQMILMELAVGREEVDAFHIGVLQLLVCGLLCFFTMMFTEEPALPQSGSVWFSVVFLSILCTGVAFIVQALAQQYTTAERVGVIFTLEPVFAGVVAFFLAGEVLAPKAYLGAVILIAGMFIMEIDFGKMSKNERDDA